MATWTLSRNGSPAKTFAAWGFGGLKRELVSQGVDVVSFEAEGAPIDSASQLDFEDEVVIYKNNVPWFTGVVSKLPVHGSASEENRTYEVSGPWYYFERQIFEQTYVGFVGSGGALTPPMAPLLADTYFNEGDNYTGTDNHSHPLPGALFHDMSNQVGGLLIRAADLAIFGFVPSSHVFLNSWIYNAYGSVQTVVTDVFGLIYTTGIVMDTGQQLTQILQNAQAAQTQILGSPIFKMGAVTTPNPTVILNAQSDAYAYWRSATVSPAVPAAISEQRDISVAEAIRTMLRWSPDAVVWFDYTQSPPMLHIGQRSSLSSVLLPSFGGTFIKIGVGAGNIPSKSVPVTGGWNISEVEIDPRFDLLVPFVRINYEQTNSFEGNNYTTKVVDTYPVNAPQYGFGAMVSTIDLQGTTTGAYSKISTASIPTMTGGTTVTGGAAYDWWVSRREWPLMQSDDVVVDGIILNDRLPPVPDGSSFYSPAQVPNELTGGQMADWMGGNQSREQITAKLYYHTKNGQQAIKPLSSTIQSTNLSTGTYFNQGQITYAEPIPDGLAETLFNSVGTLQYDGSLTISEDECTGIVGLGQILNLSPNWESMNAMVVQINEDVDGGTTKVSFGPKKNLGVGDLVELVRVIRGRVITTRFAMSYGGQSVNQVGLGNRTVTAQADATSATPVILAASQVANPSDLDPDDPNKISASLDSTDGSLNISGRESQSGLPSGDGKIKLKIGDIKNNDLMNN